ncbi:MAG: intradiol ring-cleavage dioxygenase [Rubrivivax sp.]|jgi:protocatechuate 3,4-dioxygenase beta subunit
MNTHRRHAMLGLSALLAAPATQAARPLAATPSQFAGPYYPVVPIPRISDLTAHQGHTARGQPLALAGTVVDRNGTPLNKVLVEIWQADHAGRYRHPKAPQTDRVDPGYAGFGATLTDGDGAYGFRTIVPVPYTGRPPHIHARLHLDGRELLTTQIYLAGQERESGFFFSMMAPLWGRRERLTISPQAAAPGDLRARFDFVVEA